MSYHGHAKQTANLVMGLMILTHLLITIQWLTWPLGASAAHCMSSLADLNVTTSG